MPHRIYGQHVTYMFETPTTRVWQRLHQMGKLTVAQDSFWRAKPAEELYDLTEDPDEVHNLANSPRHQASLPRLRRALNDWVLETRDVGFLPEGEVLTRSAGTTPFDMGHDNLKYPLARILAVANLAAGFDPLDLDDLKETQRDPDSAVRYWSVMGYLIRGRAGYESARDFLVTALDDPSPYVQIAAAEAICQNGTPAERQQAEAVLVKLGDWQYSSVFISMAALNTIDALDTGEIGRASCRERV
jgi:HEAT repeat protein